MRNITSVQRVNNIICHITLMNTVHMQYNSYQVTLSFMVKSSSSSCTHASPYHVDGHLVAPNCQTGIKAMAGDCPQAFL